MTHILDNKKKYMALGTGIVIAGLHASGYIPQGVYDWLKSIVGF